MEKLIKITEQNGSQVVSARELHIFLEVETPFRKWIDRMFNYGFEENLDFTRVDKNVRGNEAKEFALTLDCAKEISMIQRNDKGKQARKYFIEVEKQFKNPQLHLSRKELAYMVIEAEEKVERLELEIETKHKPRSQFLDQVFKSDSLIAMSQVAKILGLDFGRNTLYKRLREKGVLFKSTNEPKQVYVNKGYFKLKENTFTNSEGETKVTLQTFATQKGLAYIAKLFEVVVIPVNNRTKAQISA